MIDKIRSMAVFSFVVEEGSFAAAALKMGLSAAAVSKHVDALQEQIGHVLLVKRGSNLEPTDEGHILFLSAREMVRMAEIGLETMADTDRVSSGSIRISMPVFLSGGILQEIVEDFLLANPKVSMHLDFVKTPSNPLSDEYDLSVTTALVESSEISYRTLVGGGAAFYAAPDLAERIAQMEISEVIRKIPILLSTDYTASDWAAMFQNGTKGVKPNLKFRIRCDDMGLIHKLCTSGAGLAILPKSRTFSDVASGRLVPVLNDVNLKQVDFFAIWATRSHKAELILSFLDHVHDSLQRMKS
ncbi:LysR family transcriptional regulator [Roseobacter sp. N2S]|uniref:LysR family transcriptional regulator n=1 Tax=Roseobacter sp. N2S TaxID=2663844 RepID=UPI002858A0BC|nr:LysR family transcriptional regulator [Roseobacter sp. N2S]MDR6264254.1 DNA-binding transcriptional LysR family regulator [Roseobacter sp. N2S]